MHVVRSRKLRAGVGLGQVQTMCGREVLKHRAAYLLELLCRHPPALYRPAQLRELYAGHLHGLDGLDRDELLRVRCGNVHCSDRRHELLCVCGGQVFRVGCKRLHELHFGDIPRLDRCAELREMRSRQIWGAHRFDKLQRLCAGHLPVCPRLGQLRVLPIWHLLAGSCQQLHELRGRLVRPQRGRFLLQLRHWTILSRWC